MRSAPIVSLYLLAIVAFVSPRFRAADTQPPALFTQRSAWEAASTPTTTLRFESIAAPGSFTLFDTAAGLTASGVTLTGVAPSNALLPYYLRVVDPAFYPRYYDWGSGAVLHGPPVSTGPGGEGGLGSRIQMTIPAGTTAVGADIMSFLQYGSPFAVVVTTGAGTFTYNVSSFSHPQRAFVGFTSASPITSVSFAAISGFPVLDNVGVVQAPSELVVTDIFERRLNENGLTLVDWEGHIANPAVKIFVVPPAHAAFPATAVLTADNNRLYFDLPSQAGASGPTKTISFANASTRVPVFVSNFPDQDANDGQSHLTIQFTDADHQQTSLTINVHEIDQDTTDTGPYSVRVDFSQDRTGFFADAYKAGIIEQAARDWAYFVGDMHLDQVPASTETTFVWDPSGFMTGSATTNTMPYIGYLLYAYGIHSSALRSGGEPSFLGGFQSSGGISLPLKRSGGTEIETQGNFNTLGWFLTSGDHDWWVSGNLGSEQNDLYSISHHEMGHAFIFNPSQPNFSQFKQLGFVQDAAVLAYHGSYPHIDPSDHLIGEIDDASRRGAFGYEYFGDVPRRRWLITKLDLLVAQAIGYELRPTSALTPLSITTTSLKQGVVSHPYADTLHAAGGTPFYRWSIATGSLPAGLSLNSFTGVISGTPTTAGAFDFTARVQEYVERTVGITLPLRITVTASTTFTDPVLTAGLTVIKAVHITELRARIDAVRVAKGLAPFTWTDQTIAPTTTIIKAMHITDLRTALAQAYTAAGLSPPLYTNPTLIGGITMQTVHIAELRAAVIAIE